MENNAPQHNKPTEDRTLVLKKMYDRAEGMNKRLKERAHRADRYYKGDMWWETQGDEGVTVNLIYPAVENIVATMTDRKPEIVVTPAGRDQSNIENAESLQKMVRCLWDKEDMQEKMEETVRQLNLYGDAFLYTTWDEDKGEHGNIDTRTIHPEFIRVNPEARNLQEAEYIFVSEPVSVHALKRKYGKMAKDIKPMKDAQWRALYNSLDEDMDYSECALVQHFWGWMEKSEGSCTYELRHIIKVNDTIFIDELNPYFDHEGEYSVEEKKKVETEYGSVPELFSKGEVEEEDIERDIEATKQFYNFFNEERFPLTHIKTHNSGKRLQSMTSKTEQAIPLNVLYNARRTQINENANGMANPYLIIGANSGIDTDQISDDVGQIFEPNDVSEVKLLSVPAMPNYVIDETEKIRRDLDNIYGVHDISRGEVGQNRTAREAIILKEADEGGIALLIRSMKRGMEEIGRWWVHLMLLNYTEEHTEVVLGKDGSEDYVSLKRDQIDKGVQVWIDAGSIEPKDKNAERAETMELMQSGFMDPITGFERLGYSNPTEMYTDAELAKQGQLVELPQPDSPPGPPPDAGPPPQEALPPQGMPPQEGPTVPVPQF